MQSVNSFSFAEFKALLEKIVTAEGVSFEGVADDPIGDSINLTFFPDQEPIVDRIVRRARKDLLWHNHIDQNAWREEGFTFEIAKSFIIRPACWSLRFSFSDSYQLIENFQS